MESINDSGEDQMLKRSFQNQLISFPGNARFAQRTEHISEEFKQNPRIEHLYSFFFLWIIIEILENLILVSGGIEKVQKVGSGGMRGGRLQRRRRAR